jgi:ketosteroid isomerase-like protein
MLPQTGGRTGPRTAPSLVEVARTLEEARDALHGYEATALAGVAATLAEAAESLARTTRELHEMRGEEWMDAAQMRSYLSRTPKQWERIAPTLPRHYVTERGILYNRREIDEWLMGRTSPLDA